MQNHLIHRQVLDLHLDSKKEAFGIQEQFRIWYWKQFLPVLDEVLTEIAKNRSIRIERLEIDLGRMLNTGFLNLPRYLLHEKILDQFIGYAPELFDDSIPGPSKNVRILKTGQSAFEAFRFFLLNGRLPWYQAEQGPGILDQLFKTVIAEHFKDLTTFLKTHFNEKIRQRLLKQYQPEQLWKLSEKLNPELTTQVRKFSEAWQQLEAQPDWPSGKFKKINQENWLELLLDEMYKTGPHSTDHFWEYIFKKIAEINAVNEIEVVKRINPLLIKHFKPEAAFVKSYKKLIDRRGPVNEWRSMPETQKTNTTDEAEQRLSRLNEKTNFTHQEDGTEEGIIIKQAGLVLLWPYLRRFFEKLDLLEGLEFKDTGTWERAVLITYCIAGEVEEAEEHLLVLPKVLCSWPVHKPVSREIVLTESEKEEIRDLLSSVIANWPGLKNTSVEGFRSAFLQREGILVMEEEKIRVLIERQGIDVLLEQLPWSMATFKLPWTSKPFFVEW